MCPRNRGPGLAVKPVQTPDLKCIFMKSCAMFVPQRQKPQWLTAYHLTRVWQPAQHPVIAHLIPALSPPGGALDRLADNPVSAPGKDLDKVNPLDYFLVSEKAGGAELI
jgi:hypothetical protein